MKTLFLVNPTAGKSHNFPQVTGLIHAIYAGVSQPCEVRLLNFDTLAQDLAKARSKGVTRVFALGGDGTINAIGTQLVGTQVALGVIPGGSGNGLSRHIGLPIQLVKALRLSPHLETREIDTGRFGPHTFLNLAGLGLDAEIAHNFAKSQRRGLGPYVQHSTVGLLKRSPIKFELEIEGQWRPFSQVFGITFANGTQWGFQAKIAAESSLTDGLLDVTIIHRFPFLMTPPLVLRLFQGSLSRSSYITSFKTRRLKVRTQEKQLIQVDGEPLSFSGELEISVNPASLQLLVPPQREV